MYEILKAFSLLLRKRQGGTLTISTPQCTTGPSKCNKSLGEKLQDQTRHKYRQSLGSDKGGTQKRDQGQSFHPQVWHKDAMDKKPVEKSDM